MPMKSPPSRIERMAVRVATCLAMSMARSFCEKKTSRDKAQLAMWIFPMKTLQILLKNFTMFVLKTDNIVVMNEVLSCKVGHPDGSSGPCGHLVGFSHHPRQLFLS